MGSLTSLLPHWYLGLFPGLAITLTVLAFNLFGDDVGDTMNPGLRGMA
jgi:ABC-type dipeptide/oligopeptide/nickel transport system permease subunit